MGWFLQGLGILEGGGFGQRLLLFYYEWGRTKILRRRQIRRLLITAGHAVDRWFSCGEVGLVTGYRVVRFVVGLADGGRVLHQLHVVLSEDLLADVGALGEGRNRALQHSRVILLLLWTHRLLNRQSAGLQLGVGQRVASSAYLRLMLWLLRARKSYRNRRDTLENILRRRPFH